MRYKKSGLSIILAFLFYSLSAQPDSTKDQKTPVDYKKIVYTDTVSKNGVVYNVIPTYTDTVYNTSKGVTYVVIPEMADGLRGNGKIYVVVAVILAIFAGIIIYLVRLDRKMSRLEKDIHS